MAFEFNGFTVYDAISIREKVHWYFYGCSATIINIIKIKNIPHDQYFFASYSKKNGWKEASSDYPRRRLLIKSSWVESNIPKFITELNNTQYTLNESGMVGNMDFQIVNLENVPYEINIINSNSGILYRALDILQLLGTKKIGSIRLYVSENNRIKIIVNNKKYVYITKDGLRSLLLRKRSPQTPSVARCFDIDVNHIYSPSLETSTIKIIMTAFKGEEMLCQYHIGKHRIDLYFPLYKLAVECDENNHRYQKNDDKLRQKEIEIILGCSFVRYIPEDTGFNIFIVINKIHRHMMKK